jgi:RNA polymerase sigma-70 factor, ECF subfamily
MSMADSRASMPKKGRKGERGDTDEQLEELISRYERGLVSYLSMLLGERDLALDCAQDSFLRAYENLHRGKPVTAAWLWKVARNLAFNEIRRRKRSDRPGSDWEEMPDALAGERERVLRVRRALDALPPDDREVLYLFSVDRFHTHEIAAMLGVQPGAIRMRLVRARRRFQQAFEAGR